MQHFDIAVLGAGSGLMISEAALAIDPDRVAAHQGLARVAQAALEQARQALAALVVLVTAAP